MIKYSYAARIGLVRLKTCECEASSAGCYRGRAITIKFLAEGTHAVYVDSSFAGYGWTVGDGWGIAKDCIDGVPVRGRNWHPHKEYKKERDNAALKE